METVSYPVGVAWVRGRAHGVEAHGQPATSPNTLSYTILGRLAGDSATRVGCHHVHRNARRANSPNGAKTSRESNLQAKLKSRKHPRARRRKGHHEARMLTTRDSHGVKRTFRSWARKSLMRSPRTRKSTEWATFSTKCRRGLRPRWGRLRENSRKMNRRVKRL